MIESRKERDEKGNGKARTMSQPRSIGCAPFCDGASQIACGEDALCTESPFCRRPASTGGNSDKLAGERPLISRREPLLRSRNLKSTVSCRPISSWTPSPHRLDDRRVTFALCSIGLDFLPFAITTPVRSNQTALMFPRRSLLTINHKQRRSTELTFCQEPFF